MAIGENSCSAKARIEIDLITYSGSAFGFCENGDQVFINARIVNKMHLLEGDCCDAILLKNYDDKIEVTPWRVIRIMEDLSSTISNDNFSSVSEIS